MKNFAFVLLLFVFACSGDDTINDSGNCTEEARAGLNVTVKNAITGVVLGEGITVVAADGTYTETLESFESPSVFAGAWERAGNYTLTVSSEGYQTHVTEIIPVTAGVCHVNGEEVTVMLQPE